jgi:hypothetical protein
LIAPPIAVGSLFASGRVTGHKTRAIFERYNIVSPNDLRDAAQRLDLFRAGC